MYQTVCTNSSGELINNNKFNVLQFWVSTCIFRSDSIHTVTYEGHDHRQILQDKDNIRHPFALTLFGSHVYWTDWGINALVSVWFLFVNIFHQLYKNLNLKSEHEIYFFVSVIKRFDINCNKCSIYENANDSEWRLPGMCISLPQT